MMDNTINGRTPNEVECGGGRVKNTVKFIALSLYIFSASAVVHTFGLRPMFEENTGILLVIFCIAAAVYRITEEDV